MDQRRHFEFCESCASRNQYTAERSFAFHRITDLPEAGNGDKNIPPASNNIDNDCKCERFASNWPQSQYTPVIQKPLNHICSKVCSCAHQGCHCRRSCLQALDLMCQTKYHSCCLVVQKCQHVYLANEMLKSHQYISACEIPGLIAGVSELVSEQCKKFMIDIGKTAVALSDEGEKFAEEATEDVHNRIKDNDWCKHLVRSANICGKDCDGSKERIQSARKNNRNSKTKIRGLETSDENENIQPSSRWSPKSSKQKKHFTWRNIAKEWKVGSMNYEVRHELAIELDPKDWSLLARALGVPNNVIRDISLSRHKRALASFEFLMDLETRHPKERLCDLKLKILKIGRNDVVEFIGSSMKEFLGERLDKVPRESVEELMKHLEEKATPITKDWKNLAVLYNYKDEEIVYISSLVSYQKAERPTDCLINYLAKSDPLLSVAEIGLALEGLGLNRASMKLHNEYLKRNNILCN